MFRRQKRKKNMKKIFQWREYLNWRDLSEQQKINFKRAFLFPFLAYVVYSFLVNLTFPILIIIAFYFFMNYRNKNKLSR